MHAEVRKGVNGSISKLAAGLGALACAAAVAAPNDSGKIIVYVDKSAPAGGDGTSWQSAFRDLQDAIRKQHPNLKDIEMRVAQGVYTPDQGTGDRSEFFRFHGFLGSAATLSLRGSFAGLQGADPDKQDYSATRTVLSGDLQGDDGPGFTNRSDNSCLIAIIGAQKLLSIDGITVRGSSTEQLPEYAGGGMFAFVQASSVGTGLNSLQISNCSFEDNDPKRAPAGGLSASADYVVISHCRFIGNRLSDGGGGGLTLSGFGYLSDCTFDSNTARFGGALYSREGAELSACTFTRNEAEYQGGAAFGPLTARVSLFVGNRAGSSGGAIAAYEALGLVSCTVADNFAPAGSAVSVMYGAGSLTNVVVWGNTGSAYPIRLIDSIRECSIENSVLQGGSAGVELSGMPVNFASILSSDPKFIRPIETSSGIENWNYRLALGSSAKGIGGDDGLVWSSDLDGSVYQKKYGPADAGCYFATKYFCEGNIQPGNMIVDDTDFVEFVAAYNMILSPPANPHADFNRDGLVDDADFAIFVVGYDRLICPWQ